MDEEELTVRDVHLQHVALLGVKRMNAELRATKHAKSAARLQRKKQEAFSAIRFLARQLMALGDPRKEHEIVRWAIEQGNRS